MFPKTTLLSADDIGILYEKILSFMSKKGVKIQHHKMLQTFDQAGAWVDFDQELVRFPRDLVEALIKIIPPRFTLAGAESKFDKLFPVRNGKFFTGSNTGANNVIDPETGKYRTVKISDVGAWGQLLNRLEHIDMCGFPTPGDVPRQTADVHSLRAMFGNTAKHICIQPFSETSIKYLMELALVKAGGVENLMKKPIVSIFADSFTPFQIKAMDVEAVLQACRYGIPIHLSSIPVLGGTAPVTTLGAIIVAGIEVLALLMIAQLTKPGIPVIGLVTSLAMDMRTGKVAKSCIEALQTNAAASQLLKQAFHMPTQTCGFTTDRKSFGHQSLLERSLLCLMTAEAGVDIMGRPGELEAAKTMSPLQLISDNELIGMLRDIQAEGRLNEDTTAWEDILAVPPGGYFLEQPNTLNYCRKGFRLWLSHHLSESVLEDKELKGLKPMAYEQYVEIIHGKEKYEIPDSIGDEMDRIVREADLELVRR